MTKKHRVVLSVAEREQLLGRVHRGRGSAQALAHARILLKADEGADGPGWKDERIATALDVSVPTVERVRKRYATEGLAEAVQRRALRAHKPRKLDGAQEAQLIALAARHRPRVGRGGACGCWPGGWWRCTTSSTGFRTRRSADAQKNELKPWLKAQWCIPPKQSGEFVWRMEDVLDVYCRPYDPRVPQVCMDETNKQLLGRFGRPSRCWAIPPTSTTSTDDSARPTSSCSASRCVAGDR